MRILRLPDHESKTLLDMHNVISMITMG